MPHYRSVYRSTVRATLQGSPEFQDCTFLSAWSENISADLLPVIGVVTPSERNSPDTHGSNEKSTLLQVVLKRLGGEDIEDRLDDDSAAMEVLVPAALRGAGVSGVLEETTTAVNGDGDRRIGTLTMSYRVTSWRRAAS
jgi:hypothetical protein